MHVADRTLCIRHRDDVDERLAARIESDEAVRATTLGQPDVTALVQRHTVGQCVVAAR